MSDSIKWTNFFVPAKNSYLTEGHLPADQLQRRMNLHDGSEAYYCVYDLDARDDFKGYSGPARPALGLIPFDFDSEEHPDEALSDIRGFVKTLGIEDTALYYSGSKGFHCLVPHGYFGLPNDASLPKVLKSLAVYLKTQYKTLDTSVYNTNRKFRVPGSLHPSTRLYKTRIDLETLNTKDLEFIRELSKVRRNWNTDLSDLGLNKDRVRLAVLGSWLEEAAKLQQATPYQGGELDDVFQAFESFQGKVCIKRLIEDRCTKDRHITSLRIISDLYTTGIHEAEARKTMQKWANKNGWSNDGGLAEVESQLSTVYHKGHYYSYGCNDDIKRVKCSGRCPIYSKLAPENRPQVVDAPKGLMVKRKVMPAEMAVVNQILEGFNGRVVKCKGAVFRYDGMKWGELFKEDTDKFKQLIMELYSNEATNPMVESAYRTLMIHLPTTPADVNLFNANPTCVNFTNGTLHVRQSKDHTYSLEFLPHRADDWVTNVLPYEYHPESRAANLEFLNMLDRIFEGCPDKADRIRAIKQMYGAFLVPAFPHLWFLYGPPATGKSTLMLIAKHFVSKENLSSVAPQDFAGFNMESMVGKLVNMDTDVDVNTPIVDNMLKKIEDRIEFRIRRKNKVDAYGFLPGVHIFGGNAIPPTIEGSSKAHERRWTFIEFHNVMAKGNYDKEFHSWVFDQCPEGILNFAVEGLKDLLECRGHYTTPESGKEEMREWQIGSDPVEQFLEAVRDGEILEANDPLMLKENLMSRRAKVYERFKTWSEANGLQRQLLSSQAFYKAIQRKGFPLKRTEKGRFLVGIGTIKDEF